MYNAMTPPTLTPQFKDNIQNRDHLRASADRKIYMMLNVVNVVYEAENEHGEHDTKRGNKQSFQEIFHVKIPM